MGVYLSTPKTEKVSEDGENGRVKYGLSSMQGWRTTMEDAHAAVLDLDGSMSFFGVYDGHGGKEVAKFCAKHLHQELVEHHTYKAGDVATSLQKCFLRMDEMMCEQVGQKELYEMAGTSEKITGMVEEILGSPRSSDIVVQEDGDTGIVEPHADFKGVSAGSTACVTVVKNNQLVVANAGDSRCVLCRNGEAYDLSRDHKPDLEAEKERIVKAGGFIQGGRINGSLNLARAVGDMEFKQNKLLPAEKQIVTANPDVNIVQLSEDDEFFILACDGIWDCMSSQQIVDFVRDKIQSEVKLSSVCEMVFDRCLAPCAGGEGCDNMTMILVQLKKPRSCSSSSEIPMS